MSLLDTAAVVGIARREQPASVRKSRRNMLLVSSDKITLLITPRAAYEKVSANPMAPSTTCPWLPGNKFNV